MTDDELRDLEQRIADGMDVDTLEEVAEHAEELIRDARRLAYLERMFRVMSPDIDGNHVWTFTGSPTLRGPNLRAAIDNILAKEKQ